MKNDLYIAILSYGRSNLGKFVTFDELKEYLTAQGFEFDEFAVAQFFSALFINKKQPHGNDPSSPSPDGEFFLEHSGYFNLLEHEELVSARKSATQATWFASIAILISIISMFASIYYSRLQLSTPTTINSVQMNGVRDDISSGYQELSTLAKRNIDEIVDLKKTFKETSHNKSIQPTAKAP